MLKHPSFGRLALALSVFYVTSVFATRPEHRIFASAEDFMKGEFEGVSLSSDGKLALAPLLDELYETGEAYIFDMVRDATGTIYVSTGNNGKVFRVGSGGQGSLLTTLGEPAVYALALDSQGRLYAGSSPDGKVYRISPSGEAETFYEPGDKYIWDLTFDEAGNLFVATGPRGIIYRVAPSGEGRPFIDTDETHIVSLAWDVKRNLLVGTAPKGQLMRISSGGSAFVLLDSDLEEVRAIAVDRLGTVYAAAVSGGGRSATSSASATTTTVSSSADTKSTVESVVEFPTSTKGARLQVYRIDRDDLVTPIYSSNDELAYDLVVRPDTSVLLATGDKGRVLALNQQGFLTLLADSREEQVTRLLEQSGEIFVATSNLGKLLKLSAGTRGIGTFESEVIDAGTTARWGTIRWRVISPSSSDSVKLFTRIGNTSKPDGTWTDWSGPYTNPDGSALTNPQSRFLQWKIEFSGGAGPDALIAQKDLVDLVSVSFQQRNMAPQVSSLTVLAPGVALAKIPGNQPGGVQPGGPDGAHAQMLPRAIRDLETPSAKPPSRRIYIPGSRSFTWRGTDPNGDDLVYRLSLRREEESRWTVLEEELQAEEYTLDGVSLADGTYYLKVEVSDLPSNPPNESLSSELISKPFIISNETPRIEWDDPRIEGGQVELRFRARSGISPLYQVEYSADGRNWRVVYPEDGITDTSEESFVVRLEGLRPGRQTVTVRVTDILGNLGTSLQTVEIP